MGIAKAMPIDRIFPVAASFEAFVDRIGRVATVRHLAFQAEARRLNVAGSRPVSRSKPHFVLGTTLSLVGRVRAKAVTGCYSARPSRQQPRTARKAARDSRTDEAVGSRRSRCWGIGTPAWEQIGRDPAAVLGDRAGGPVRILVEPVRRLAC